MTSPSLGAASTDEMIRQFDSAIDGLRAMAVLQRQYDKDMWDISDPQFANLRHIHLHLSSTIGKIARIVEPWDHRMYAGEVPNVSDAREDLSPILADLVMHAVQIANMIEGDLGEMIKARYQQNSARFAPGTVFSNI